MTAEDKEIGAIGYTMQKLYCCECGKAIHNWDANYCGACGRLLPEDMKLTIDEAKELKRATENLGYKSNGILYAMYYSYRRYVLILNSKLIGIYDFDRQTFVD